MFPILDKEAIYVIEDVAKPEIVMEIVKKLDVRPFWWDVKECGKRYDDRLIILGKNR
ncbi:MAG: hypothetical protein AAB599_00680 [Patescibacteria group bacterium]